MSETSSGLDDDCVVAVDGPDDGVTACGVPTNLVPSVHDWVKPVGGQKCAG